MQSLYLVKVREGSYNSSESFYVIADDSAQAFEMVKEHHKRLNHSYKIILRTIELLAEAANYPDCGNVLLISKTGD